MNRRSFFKWATATGATLFLPSSVRPTRQWKFVEEYPGWALFKDPIHCQEKWLGWYTQFDLDVLRRREKVQGYYYRGGMVGSAPMPRPGDTDATHPNTTWDEPQIIHGAAAQAEAVRLGLGTKEWAFLI